MPRIGEAFGYELLLKLGREVAHLDFEHHRLSPPRGSIAVGGAHMDPFFRAEGLRGIQRSLRNGNSIPDAIAIGQLEAKKAIQIWNSQREYQVCRWENSCDSFLETFVHDYI